MYHETPIRTHENKMVRSTIKVLLFLLLVGVCVGAYQRAVYQLSSDSEVIIRDAVISSAVQCYAIEGTYPQSIEYLQQNYGLVLDETHFIVTYEAFASNVMPDVVVLSK